MSPVTHMMDWWGNSVTLQKVKWLELSNGQWVLGGRSKVKWKLQAMNLFSFGSSAAWETTLENLKLNLSREPSDKKPAVLPVQVGVIFTEFH